MALFVDRRGNDFFICRGKPHKRGDSTVFFMPESGTHAARYRSDSVKSDSNVFRGFISDRAGGDAVYLDAQQLTRLQKQVMGEFTDGSYG